ncbi:MAG: hypothetical protein AAFY82_07425, partial [Pseudomonadota bacterium]
MIILFLIILLIVLAGIFVMWASRLPGGLTLDLGNGTLYEFELVWALLAILLVGAAMALVWAALMDSGQGVINNTFQLIGLPRVNWFGNEDVVLYSLAIISLWS